jgi:hypothetical protein
MSQVNQVNQVNQVSWIKRTLQQAAGPARWSEPQN